MKRPFIVFILSLILMISLVGCQKSWTCTCTNGAPSQYLQGDTKGQAVTVCNNYESNLQAMYPNSTCNI